MDDEILKTLKSIERLLGKSSSSFGGGSTRPAIGGGTSNDRSEASDARAREANESSYRKLQVSTGKAVDRLGYSSNRASENLKTMSSRAGMAGAGLGELSGTVTKAIAQIAGARAELGKINMSTTLESLQQAVESAAGSIKAQALSKGDTTGFAKTVGTLDHIIDNQVNPRLGIFASSLNMASKTLIGLWGDMREQRRDGGKEIAEFGKGVAIAANALSRNRGVGEYFEKFILQLRKANVALRELRGGARTRAGGMGGGGVASSADAEAALADNGTAKKTQKKDGFFNNSFVNKLFSPVGAAIAYASQRFISAGVKIIDDAFNQTGARGFGVLGKNFLTLSMNAGLAGMSLEEYTKVMDESEGAWSRMPSFEAFDKQLDVGRDALAKFGVFGADATKLTATMISSSQSLGVPVTDLSKSIEGQMSVFENLRKTTGITADQFAALNQQLAESETVQKELIGLAPGDRAARQTQLLQTAAWGKSLGLTTQQSTALTQALLDQRKTTVKDRFQARGRTMQAMSLVGMDPATVAEAAALAGKRMKTPEEEKRLLDIMGEYNKRAEDIKQNGSDGMANAVETSQASLNETSMGEVSKASIAVKAAQESGNQINADSNKKLDGLTQFFGKLITVMEGLAKSPIIQFGVGAVVASLGALQAVDSVLLSTMPARMVAAFRLGGLGLGSKVGGPASAALGGVEELTSSLGADGSGGSKTTDAAGKPKGKWGSRFSKLGRGLGKGVPYIGTMIGAGMAINDFSNADKEASVENGGDGDVGKKKGEAIGEGMGSVAGGVIGAALFSFIPVLGTALGGILGSFVGGWGGKLLGGLFGSENATEKNTRETKRLNDEMIKSKRAGAGSDIISSGNLGGLTANVLQTGQAYSDLSASEKAANQDKVDKTNGTGKYTPETVSVADYDTMGNATGTFHDEPNPAFKGTTAQAVATPTQTIATPVSTTPSSVNQAALNTAATTAATEAAAVATAASPTLATTSSTGQQASLADILKVLQDNLAAENSQTEMVAQLLRSPAFASRLPDNQIMMSNAIRTA